MDRLPSELLLQIAGHLQQKDLINLSLTSRKHRPVAQEALYYRPSIPEQRITDHDTPSKIRGLLQGLIRRPQNGNYVTELALCPKKRYVSVTADIIAGISQDQGSPLQNIVLQLLECQLVGFLLVRLPKLEELSLEVLKDHGHTLHEHREDRYVRGPLRAIFGKDEGGYNASLDLASIPGLKNLKKLRLLAGMIEWGWFQLPSLQEIYVGRECRMPPAYLLPPGQSSNIECLQLECTVKIFSSHMRRDYADLGDLFQRLPHLTRQSLIISNWFHPVATSGSAPCPMTILNAHNVNTFMYLVLQQLLNPLVNTLGTLEISVSKKEHPGFLDHIHPPLLLTSFQHLRHIKLPYDTLLVRHGNGDELPMYPSTILPASIQKVEITYPKLSVLRWLDNLVYDHGRGVTPHLDEVYLYPSEQRGDGFEAFELTREVIQDPVWDKLIDAGIFVLRMYTDFEVSINYGGKNYDPAVGQVVEYLDSLGAAIGPGPLKIALPPRSQSVTFKAITGPNGQWSIRKIAKPSSKRLDPAVVKIVEYLDALGSPIGNRPSRAPNTSHVFTRASNQWFIRIIANGRPRQELAISNAVKHLKGKPLTINPFSMHESKASHPAASVDYQDLTKDGRVTDPAIDSFVGFLANMRIGEPSGRK